MVFFCCCCVGNFVKRENSFSCVSQIGQGHAFLRAKECKMPNKRTPFTYDVRLFCLFVPFPGTILSEIFFFQFVPGYLLLEQSANW